MNDPRAARLLFGRDDLYRQALEAWNRQPLDLDTTGAPWIPYAPFETTIRAPVTLRGPGTFLGKAMRTLTLAPQEGEGWWFERTDLAWDLPTRASVRNVWTTGQVVSNIVLRSGNPHNYVRMVEHIVALKLGMGVDRLNVRLDSGDPPLFDRGSLDLVEAIERAEIVETKVPARYWTVREPVAVVQENGAFVAIFPPTGPEPRLILDAAVDFPTAIGRQRIRFPLDRARFREGSVARTNTSAAKKLYCQTIGKIFADIRNLGYTSKNLLVAGRTRYVNEPRLMHQGKSLEAAWHRAALDLLAALSLVEEGRLAGEIFSYKAGHALDVRLVTLLYKHNLLTPFPASGLSAPARID